MTTRAEREMAAGHWLLASARSRPDAVDEWREEGATLLRTGLLFGAVSTTAALVHAAVGVATPQECAAPLAEALDGPLFYEPDPSGSEDAYTALIPASAALRWRLPESAAHPYRAMLLVPAPDRTSPGADPTTPWWVVPVDGPGNLCPANRVAALLALGRDAVSPTGGGAA
ncbi:hypothetical protein [Streptomyces sp. NPDC046685]|uniref:hypothetical protein n=1 Tax=Streptomyces sp. NPDC046685 TaxID=3157202 RepID=UPI0033C71257